MRWQPPATRPLQRLEAALPAAYALVGGEAVLEHVQPTARAHHPPASRSASAGSGMVHRLKVTSALSCESSGEVEALAVEPGARRPARRCARAARSDSSQPRSEGSIAVTDVDRPGDTSAR